MEEKEKVNPDLYKKEFALLNRLKGKFDYSFFKNPVFGEANFFCVIAWYIEELKKASFDDWEQIVKQLIDDALRIEDVYDRWLFVSKAICEIEIQWYSANNDNDRYRFNLNLIRDIYGWLDDRYNGAKEKGETGFILSVPGIPTSFVPQWYWTWFDGNDLEKRVMEENRQNFLRSVRERNKRYNDETDED